MNIYFIIICAMSFISLGIDMGKHGELKKNTLRRHNAFNSLIATVITITLITLAVRHGW